eukprot:1323262-Pleurochrysis_carterae.AAC.1
MRRDYFNKAQFACMLFATAHARRLLLNAPNAYCDSSNRREQAEISPLKSELFASGLLMYYNLVKITVQPSKLAVSLTIFGGKRYTQSKTSEAFENEHQGPYGLQAASQKALYSVAHRAW